MVSYGGCFEFDPPNSHWGERAKTPQATGRLGRRSSFLGHPGASQTHRSPSGAPATAGTVNSMKRLSDLTRRFERAADASAFFQTRVQRGLNRDVPSTLDALRVRLSGQHFRDLEQSIARKAAVDPLSTFADPSLAEPYGWPTAFLGLIEAETALDNIGARVVPMNTHVPLTTGTSEFDWVGESAPAPVSKMTFASGPIAPAKIAGIRMMTKELLLASNPSAQAIVQADSVRAVAVAVDQCAWDPSRAAVSDVSPSSLTHSAAQVVASGSTGEAVEADAAALLAAISGGNPTRPFFIANRRVAIFLSSKRLTTGQKSFPKLSAMGGSIFGVPIAIGMGVPDLLGCVDADRVLLAGGGVAIDVTVAASLQMDTAAATGAQSRVSTFQTGLVGLKTSRFLNWQAASDAVSYRIVSPGGSPE
jgi:hypothetical protein